MQVVAHTLSGVYIITAEPRGDERGYFMRTYDETWFREKGLHRQWVQENQSFTRAKGTLRGLHFQWPPASETKLIRCLQGSVFDAFVDLRKHSATFGQWGSIELSASQMQMLWLPRGFAHGFCTLEENCLLQYKVDNAYSPANDSGIRWNDPDIGIAWPETEPLLSAKDSRLMSFRELVNKHGAINTKE